MAVEKKIKRVGCPTRWIAVRSLCTPAAENSSAEDSRARHTRIVERARVIRRLRLLLGRTEPVEPGWIARAQVEADFGSGPERTAAWSTLQ